MPPSIPEPEQHLLDTLKEFYTVTTDWEGEQYCALHLKWDYTKRTVQLSMPGYITRALQSSSQGNHHGNNHGNNPCKHHGTTINSAKATADQVPTPGNRT